MRVLLVSPRFHGGGAERAARELFLHLPQVDVTPTMWTALRRRDDPPVPRVRSLRLPGERWLFPLNRLPGIFDWRHFGSRLALRENLAQRFDVVHLHNVHGDWVSIRALARLCQHMPVVWTLHDEWAVTRGMAYDLGRWSEDAAASIAGLDRRMPFAAGKWSRRWDGFLQRHLPRPRVVITPSRYLRDLARASGNFGRASVVDVPNGLTLLDEPACQASDESARAHWQLASDRPVVLLIAVDVNVPYKGMDLAVRSLNQLARQWDTSVALPSVLVLGRGAKHLAGRLDAKLSPRAGWADDARSLALAYRAASVMLTASRADNFPYTVLESLACACPVVAFAVGGLPQMLGGDDASSPRRGVLVEPYDTDAMARSLMAVLTDQSGARAMGAAGRAWVRQHCDFRKYLSRVVEQYRFAIDRGQAED